VQSQNHARDESTENRGKRGEMGVNNWGMGELSKIYAGKQKKNWEQK